MPARKTPRVSRYREFDWYDTPLYYDLVFEEDTDREGEFIAEMQRRFGTTRGRQVLEPACGSGRLVEEMVRRGFAVTGSDLNPHMLRFTRDRLKQQGLRATLKTDRMEDFRSARKFDLAHCLVSTFKYLLDEDSARRHLECMAQALKPGGIYVLGFHLSDYEQTTRTRERWIGERDGVRVTCVIQSWPPARRTRKERVRSRLVVEEEGQEVRGYETIWDFRTYDAAQFRRLLKKVPTLEHVATYDFCYELGRRRHEFDDEQLDNVVILRRRAEA